VSVELIDTDGGICVHVPMAIKRRSGRKEVIVPDGIGIPADANPNYHEAVVVAISRAYRWKKLLDEGRYGSVTELAVAAKINRHYAARLLRLTLLAPDIVMAILDGRDPDGFSLNRVVGKFPAEWGEQKALYGF
jgi:hypothetical protein